MADPAQKGVALEEDDEFEEFQEQEDWTPTVEDLKKKELWDKSWDDDSLEDPLGQQLRAHIPTVLNQPPQPQQPQQTK